MSRKGLQIDASRLRLDRKNLQTPNQISVPGPKKSDDIISKSCLKVDLGVVLGYSLEYVNSYILF